MAPRSQSFRSHPRPYRAAADMILRLLRIFVPLAIVGAIFYFLIDRPQTVTGRLRVTSDVKGAEVLLDGMQVGVVTDTTLSRVVAGHRSVAVRKSGYLAEPEVLFIDVKQDTLTVVTFHLIERTTASQDSDSMGFLESLREDIPIDWEQMSSPPASSSGAARNRSDESEEEFAAAEKIVEHDTATPIIAPEQPPVRVQESISGASIAVSSKPPGAEIIINGDSTGHQTNYTFQDLLRGTYFVAVRKQGYVAKPEIMQVDLSRDYQSEFVAFALTVDESLPSPQITVSTEPIEAGIRLEGKPVGRGHVVLDVALGKSLIEFEDVVGYRTPPSQLVQLTPETTSMEIIGRYERLEGKAFLAVMPARTGAIKGEELRIWVDNELIVDKLAQKLDGILLHKLIAGKRLVQVEYQSMIQTIDVDLLDDEVSTVTFAVESFFSKKNLRLRIEPVTALKDWQKRTRKLTIVEPK